MKAQSAAATLAALLLAFPAPAGSQEPDASPEATRATMRQIVDSLAFVLPLSLSDEPFADPVQHRAILDALDTTVIEGQPETDRVKGIARTGLTVIFPQKNIWDDQVYAGAFSMNGNGEMTGLLWVEESGTAWNPDRHHQYAQRRLSARCNHLILVLEQSRFQESVDDPGGGRDLGRVLK